MKRESRSGRSGTKGRLPAGTAAPGTPARLVVAEADTLDNGQGRPHALVETRTVK